MERDKWNCPVEQSDDYIAIAEEIAIEFYEEMLLGVMAVILAILPLLLIMAFFSLQK